MKMEEKPKTKKKKEPFVRVEQHIIKETPPAYEMLAEFCHMSKNLYNQGNYLLRQQFFAHEKQSSYEQLDKILKAKTDFPDYRNMPTAQSAQQNLRLLVTDWKSFWEELKDWKKHRKVQWSSETVSFSKERWTTCSDFNESGVQNP